LNAIVQSDSGGDFDVSKMWFKANEAELWFPMKKKKDKIIEEERIRKAGGREISGGL
jgi:uncharacterized membrane protein